MIRFFNKIIYNDVLIKMAIRLTIYLNYLTDSQQIYYDWNSIEYILNQIKIIKMFIIITFNIV